MKTDVSNVPLLSWNPKSRIDFALSSVCLQSINRCVNAYEKTFSFCDFYTTKVSRLGLTQWFLNHFESKFDDTRISSFSKLRQPTGQILSNVRTQQRKISIAPILSLYYEESLVSPNLNSNLLRFHCAHPNLDSILVIHIRF